MVALLRYTLKVIFLALIFDFRICTDLLLIVFFSSDVVDFARLETKFLARSHLSAIGAYVVMLLMAFL